MDLTKQQATIVLASLGDKATKNVKFLKKYCEQFSIKNYLKQYLEHRKHKIYVPKHAKGSAKAKNYTRERISIDIDPKVLFAIQLINTFGNDESRGKSRVETLEVAFWDKVKDNFFELSEDKHAELLEVLDLDGIDRQAVNIVKSIPNGKDKQKHLRSLIERLKVESAYV